VSTQENQEGAVESLQHIIALLTTVEGLTELIRWGGLLLLVAIVFAETGLLVGFFLPGDSLLFAVGLFIAQGIIDMPLWLACVLLTIAAFAGNVSGYYIGRMLGTALFKNPNARILKPQYLARTHEFFDRYGNRAIVMARFVPIVRTFITLVAGASRMDKRRFFIYTGIGAVLWATGVTVLGYYLGRVAFIRDHLETALILIVLVSVVPMVIDYMLTRRRNKAANERMGTTEPTRGTAR
jgi:membrane-associated protein